MNDDDARFRRNRLVGRIVIVVFGLLLAAYVAATFLRR